MTLRFAVSADSCSLRVAALLAALSTQQPLAAAQDHVELEWNAPPPCPKAAAVLARTHALAGKADDSHTPLRAAATVERGKDGLFHLRLVVTLDGRSGERTLEAHVCEDLAGATAVHLALLLRNGGGSTAPTPDANATVASAASAPNADTTGPEPIQAPAADSGEAQPRQRADTRWLLQLPRAALSFGPLPSASFGVLVAGGVELGRWSLTLGGTVWLSQSLPSARPDSSADVHRIEASLRVCHAFPFGRLSLMPCVAVSLQELQSRGVGPNIRSKLAAATWLSGDVGIAARWQVTSWLNLLGNADIQAQTARPRISIDGLGQLAELGPVAVQLSLGPEWIL